MDAELTFKSVDGKCVIKYCPWHVGIHALLDIKSPSSNSWGIRINREHWQEWLDGLRSVSDKTFYREGHETLYTKISTINDQVFIFDLDISGMTLEFGLNIKDALTLADRLEKLSLNPEKQQEQDMLEKASRDWHEAREKERRADRQANNSKPLNKIKGILNVIFGRKRGGGNS